MPSDAEIVGRLFDGLSAKAHAVSIRSTALSIIVTFTESRAVQLTPLEFPRHKCTVVSRPDSSFALKLDRDVSVTLEGPNVQRWICEAGLSRNLSALIPQRWSTPYLILWLTLLTSMVGISLWGTQLLPSMIMQFISVELEERLGERFAGELVSKFGGACRRHEGQQALQRYVNSMLQVAGSRRKVDIRIVASKEINAFAAPGGHIFVLQGLISATRSGEELAAVVGHELGHVLHRHSLKRLVEKFGLRVLVSYFGINVSGIADLSLELSGVIFEMAYSRSDEREADQTGMELLQKAEIDSRGAAAFFKRLQEKGGEEPEILAFLGSHPTHSERIRELDPLGSPGKAAFSEQEWHAIKNACK